MQKIIINGKQATIEDFIDLFRDSRKYEELDYDALGDILDVDTLAAAIDSFTGGYNAVELIEKYLQLADKPIDFNFPIPKLRVD